jgi:CDP-diacylglycerol--glycerol-3-phosphate 3-phosphatidyltransferase
MATGKQAFKNRARGVLNPIVSALAVLGVPPIFISFLGLLLSFYGAVVLARGSLFWAGVILLASGLCDVLDGSLARARNVAGRFGAFIDSTFDRITEFAYFGGIIIYLVDKRGGYSVFEIVVTFVALAGSVLTSYTRARAEGLGFKCTVGMFERPERIALLVLGLLLGRYVLIGVLLILSVTTVITTLQRIFHIYRLTHEEAAQNQTESSD